MGTTFDETVVRKVACGLYPDESFNRDLAYFVDKLKFIKSAAELDTFKLPVLGLVYATPSGLEKSVYDAEDVASYVFEVENRGRDPKVVLEELRSSGRGDEVSFLISGAKLLNTEHPLAAPLCVFLVDITTAAQMNIDEDMKRQLDDLDIDERNEYISKNFLDKDGKLKPEYRGRVDKCIVIGGATVDGRINLSSIQLSCEEGENFVKDISINTFPQDSGHAISTNIPDVFFGAYQKILRDDINSGSSLWNLL